MVVADVDNEVTGVPCPANVVSGIYHSVAESSGTPVVFIAHVILVPALSVFHPGDGRFDFGVGIADSR